jgi:hypothetical protein
VSNEFEPRAKKPRVPRESEIERAFVAREKCALKFVSPGRRGVPDRLVLRPVPEAVRDLVAQYVRFVELKRPGEKPRPEQVREHERLRALGYRVDVIDNMENYE